MIRLSRRAAFGLTLATAMTLMAPSAPALAQRATEPGGRIQYLSATGTPDVSDLYEIRPDRTNHRLLISNLYGRLPDNATTDYPYRLPVYSPDLRTIVYTATDHSVWTARADGSRGRPIVTWDSDADPFCDRVCGLSGAQFSPDGSRIASVEPGISGQRARVVVFDVNGSNLRVFPLNQDFCCLTLQGRYSWSADGNRIAYAMGPEDTQLSAIFVTDLRTGSTSRLTDMRAWRTDVSFSPDGRTLAFSGTGRVGVGEGVDAERDLYTLEIDTRRVRRLTVTLTWNEYRPVYSPDGGWFAYDRRPFGQSHSVKPVVRRIAVNGTADQTLGVNGEVYGWLR
ncbi:MAG TPA: hypothetical protein VF755_24205 [Catenuloplanes sp.]|jgi:WD40 repeat protein